MQHPPRLFHHELSSASTVPACFYGECARDGAHGVRGEDGGKIGGGAIRTVKTGQDVA